MLENALEPFSKLPGSGLSIFAVMSKMAVDYHAINLSQGFPDFNCSEELIALVNKYQRKGFNQYAPMPGVPIFREKIAAKIKSLYNREYNNESEITVTAGATQALFTAITAFIKKGDEAIIIEPAYDSYAPVVILSGGTPKFVSMGSDFSFDWEAVQNAITEKTKMIIINSPHNPTGYVLSEADIKNIEEMTRKTNIILLSDEVYEHIIFDGKKHLSLCQSDELSQRTLVISSFGKTYHATGWKVGYCAAPKTLTDEFRKIHQFIVFAVNTPVQYAYADYMQEPNYYLSLNSFYQSKRDLLISSLKNSRFKIRPAKGTYFQLLDYSDISDMNDMDFSTFLTKEIGVAVIPISPFCSMDKSRRIIRACFAKKDEVLLEAAEKLCAI
jgi:methionine aminotransferase